MAYCPFGALNPSGETVIAVVLRLQDGDKKYGRAVLENTSARPSFFGLLADVVFCELVG